MADDDPVELPIDGVLDLHTFSPREVKDLVPEYIGECLRRGITEIRIIHGKGTGDAQGRSSTACLKRTPASPASRMPGSAPAAGAPLRSG